jgi:hypothetical protein
MISRTAKTVTTFALLLVLGGIAVVDAYYGNRQAASVTTGTQNAMMPIPPNGGTSDQAPTMTATTGVAKNNGVTLEQAAQQADVTLVANQEDSILAVFGKELDIQQAAIMQGNDRAGSATCAVSPDIKPAFSTIKEGLVSALSSEVENLRDETIQDPEGPVRNIVSFNDPAIYDGTVEFVRVRQTLCEFRIDEGKEQVMERFIAALTV